MNALSRLSQLIHGGVVGNFLYCVSGHYASDRLREEEAGGAEALVGVAVVQLEDLVEGCFCNLAHTLVEAPSVEHLLHILSLLHLFHALEENDGCAEELVFG